MENRLSHPYGLRINQQGTEHCVECKILHLRKQVWANSLLLRGKVILAAGHTCWSCRVNQGNIWNLAGSVNSPSFFIQKRVLSGFRGPAIVLGAGIKPVRKLDLVTAHLVEDIGTS